MKVTKTTYRARVEKLLKKKGLVVATLVLTDYINSGYEKELKPFQLIQRIVTNETGPRQENLAKAEKNFQVVLEEACKAFSLDIGDALDHSEDKDWIALRGIVSYVALMDYKISPQRIVSTGLGMANPSMVHHAYYRGQKLIDNQAVYNQKHREILLAIKDDMI